MARTRACCDALAPATPCRAVFNSSNAKLAALQVTHGRISGGSPAIPVQLSARLRENVYLMVVHTQRARRYDNFVITFESAFGP